MGIKTIDKLLEDIEKDRQKRVDTIMLQDIEEQCKIWEVIC